MRRWDVLAAMIYAEGFTKFVEVGTKEGRTTAHILQECPNVQVTALDPWCEMPSQGPVSGGEAYDRWDFDAIENSFWERVDPWKDRLTFLRRTSEEAAPAVEDGSQDLVFIDAAHDYDSVKQDIELWIPKVKDGGILAGHDFQHSFPTVMDAVADSFNLMFVEVMPDSVWWVRC